MKVSRLALLVLIGSSIMQASANLSPAPSGYTWLHLEDIAARILKPEGWHVRRIEKGNVVGYEISEEDPSSQDFLTGLSIRCSIVDKEKTRLSASDMARAIYRDRKSKGNISDLILGKNGDYVTFTFDHDEMREIDDKVVQQHFVSVLLANDRTSVLTYVYFECPLDVWAQKAPICATILSDVEFGDSDEEPNQSAQTTPVSAPR